MRWPTIVCVVGLLCSLHTSRAYGQSRRIDPAGGYAAGAVGETLRGLKTQGITAAELLMFGGENQADFLGCLTCPPVNPNSIANKLTYGNKFGGTSIFNKASIYRNPYASVSLCNPHALTPPIVVDVNGKFYVEMTRNQARPARVTAPVWVRWLGALCAGDLD